MITENSQVYNPPIGIFFHNTVVSRIYAPRFATLTVVESVGGAYMRELTFYLANTPPLPVPRLDVIILQTDRSCRPALATSSETR